MGVQGDIWQPKAPPLSSRVYGSRLGFKNGTKQPRGYGNSHPGRYNCRKFSNKPLIYSTVGSGVWWWGSGKEGWCWMHHPGRTKRRTNARLRKLSCEKEFFEILHWDLSWSLPSGKNWSLWPCNTNATFKVKEEKGESGRELEWWWW